MFSNDTQRLLSGQPSEVLPLPQYMVYLSSPFPLPSWMFPLFQLAMAPLFTYSPVSRLSNSTAGALGDVGDATLATGDGWGAAMAAPAKRAVTVILESILAVVI